MDRMAERRICPFCKYSNDDVDVFCRNCGNEIVQLAKPAKTIVVEEPSAPVEPKAAPALPTMRTAMCPRCGRHIRSDARFCPYCGHSFSVPTRCTTCGMMMRPGSTVCNFCGRTYSSGA